MKTTIYVHEPKNNTTVMRRANVNPQKRIKREISPSEGSLTRKKSLEASDILVVVNSVL